MIKTLSKSSSRRALYVLFSAVLFAGCEKKTAPPAPPPEVLVTEVRQEDVPIYDDFVGTLDGSVNASIQAHVQGYLTSQNYKEGGVGTNGRSAFPN